MARPSSKSVAQRLKEAEEKALRLKAQAAKESGNPIIASLSDMLETGGKDINVLSRALKGPNSFEYRIRAGELKDAFVRAEESYALAKDAILRKRREFLHNAIATAGNEIANGRNPDLNTILADMPVDPNIDTLANELAMAKEAWRSYVASKGGSDAESNEDANGSDAGSDADTMTA